MAKTFQSLSDLFVFFIHKSECNVGIFSKRLLEKALFPAKRIFHQSIELPLEILSAFQTAFHSLKRSYFLADDMGNCNSEHADSNKRNQKINAIIEKDRRTDELVIKLLLLGAGESGKSTVLKQMKIIHDNGFSPEEARQKRTVVHSNVIQSMGALINGLQIVKVPLANSGNTEHASRIIQCLERKEETNGMTKELYDSVYALWNDKGIKAAFERKDEFYLHDSAAYFLDSLERIYPDSYVPTEQDILHTRVATMGVIEVMFRMKNKTWRVFDVGGQRSQRKKWIHCFDDAKAIIYVASLSEYDQVLVEDNVTNRMQESIHLFKQVINSKFFTSTSVILFLNKKDLFAQKIGHGRSLTITFPDYKGSESYEPASHYIEKRYLSVNENPNKNIYCHHTCATDTEQVQFVLDSVLDTILSSKLKGCGLY
ncbi:unnamed protein product, partial [Mesorhabditis belari]|uniref:Uncharacterized protein n=1 Tax=Mesorhabditis belari TaxID=2138241 RepID=A0AAF3FDR3_9BILA